MSADNRLCLMTAYRSYVVTVLVKTASLQYGAISRPLQQKGASTNDEWLIMEKRKNKELNILIRVKQIQTHVPDSKDNNYFSLVIQRCK